ncbi:nitronate monooxygenase [bacterium BMS3Bbin05]|nr:nitronate monooxygenase [bacterium BMS3Bbin05]
MVKSILKEQSLLAPVFSSEKEKNDYLEAVFSRKILFPIMNGGMGIDFSNEDLAGAVISAGGIGVLAASLVGYNDIFEEKLENMPMEERKKLIIETDKAALSGKIRKVRQDSQYGILGINLMRAVNNYEILVKVIGESKSVDILFVGAGLPTDLPVEMLRYPHMRYAPIISSVRAARIMLKRAQIRKGRKPDAWYVELPQFAGGHLGAGNAEEANDHSEFRPIELYNGLRELDPDIPIILAGGIMYREDIEKALEQGFNGVSCGTRMLLTRESGMSDEIIKEFYLNPMYPVITTMTSPAGMPSRYIDNGFLKAAAKVVVETRKRCVSCIGIKNCGFMNRKTPFCIAHWLSKTRRGLKDGLLFTGSRLDEIRNDGIYSKKGETYIPTIREAIDLMLNNLFSQQTCSPAVAF